MWTLYFQHLVNLSFFFILLKSDGFFNIIFILWKSNNRGMVSKITPGNLLLVHIVFVNFIFFLITDECICSKLHQWEIKYYIFRWTKSVSFRHAAFLWFLNFSKSLEIAILVDFPFLQMGFQRTWTKECLYYCSSICMKGNFK